MLSSISTNEIISDFILFSSCFYIEKFAYLKYIRTFAPAIGNQYRCNRNPDIPEHKDGPFVYRLGRKIFILERGVRFPHGLLKRNKTAGYSGVQGWPVRLSVRTQDFHS